MVLLKEGKQAAVSRFEASERGDTLRQSMTLYMRNGKGTTTEYTLKRKGGTGKPAPFIGAWEVDSAQTKYPNEDVFTVTQKGSVLALIDPSTSLAMTFDLKTGHTTITGPAVPADYAITSRIVNERSLEMAWSTGKARGMSLFSVSADGRTMTQTDVSVGEDGKKISSALIYERQ